MPIYTLQCLCFGSSYFISKFWVVFLKQGNLRQGWVIMMWDHGFSQHGLFGLGFNCWLDWQFEKSVLKLSVGRYGAPFRATKSNYVQTSKLPLKCSARVSYFVEKFSYYLNCPTFYALPCVTVCQGVIFCKAPMQPNLWIVKRKRIIFQSYSLLPSCLFISQCNICNIGGIFIHKSWNKAIKDNQWNVCSFCFLIWAAWQKAGCVKYHFLH